MRYGTCRCVALILGSYFHPNYGWIYRQTRVQSCHLFRQHTSNLLSVKWSVMSAQSQKDAKRQGPASHSLFTLLPSDNRYRGICSHTTRLQSSMSPQTVMLCMCWLVCIVVCMCVCLHVCIGVEWMLLATSYPRRQIHKAMTCKNCLIKRNHSDTPYIGKINFMIYFHFPVQLRVRCT